MKALGIGKIRGLQELSTEHGSLAVLALDQRGSLIKALKIDESDPDLYIKIREYKMELVGELLPLCSAVLLDPQFSAAEAICSSRINSQKGLIVATEETGYIEQSDGRLNQVIPGWSLGKAKRMGASAAKLLTYYNPEIESMAREQEDFIKSLVEEAEYLDIPLLLEPMSYSVDPDMPKRSPEFAKKRPRIVQQTAKNLGNLGVDLLKLEFPCDHNFEKDRSVWQEECNKVTEFAPVPWVLLSAGVDYDVFRQQLEVACKAGAAGFVAGRAIWKEAAEVTGKERTAFLKGTARERIKELVDIVNQHASKWQDMIESGFCHIDSGWHKDYKDLKHKELS